MNTIRLLVAVLAVLLVMCVSLDSQSAAPGLYAGHVMIGAEQAQGVLHFPTPFSTSIDCTLAAYSDLGDRRAWLEPSLEQVTVHLSAPVEHSVYFGVACFGT